MQAASRGNERRTLLAKAAFLDFTVKVMRGLQGQDGFQMQPRHWFVEQIFTSLMRYCHLFGDYEQRLDIEGDDLHRAQLNVTAQDAFQ